VTLNFFDKNNNPIDIRLVEQAANEHNISLRTGCFCNPGAGEIALQISRMELAACFSQSDHVQRLTYDDFRTCIDDKASGAVRISVGMVSNFEDVQAVLKFAEGLME
jgi:selenocysteine lyase/cysteine desulfurase